MNISAHEQNNAFYTAAQLVGSGSQNTPWVYAWTSQQLVTSAIVTATGGTYE